ncbi:MAG TPA: ATP-binding protein, partial [Pyrinomonadaceae bacterium]|nr:ATP-binding protein [Pyrinomonadaceae bacterium]
MNSPFLISDERLRALTATRQGRVSIAGYNYQAAYAVARLASMSLRQPVLDIDDWPLKLRYDWGEDLDEACNDGTIRFTQCKRVQTIGQAASLAEVLIGFAPKWLWVHESHRDKLGFRLVCSDSRFAETSTPPHEVKAEVLETFTKRLDEPAGQRSDRFQWADDASKVGHDVLFEALWTRLECIYLPADVIESGPAGRRLEAEKEALRMLLEWGHIDPSRQPDVLAKLRRLIHDNLISFDPTNDAVPMPVYREPRCVNRADVEGAINPYRPASQRQSLFRLVDRTFLSEQRELDRKQFVARQPEWSDLVHGPDDTIKFIERDQTEALEREVMQQVVARVGAGKLPTLFVVGAPGDGKTTITRRVAARLVEAGAVLIADTGVGLQEPP